MKTKAREYLAKAKRCDQRATKVRDAERREWQMILARAYRMLAEAESEATAKRLSAAAKPPRADGDVTSRVFALVLWRTVWLNCER